MRDHQDGQLFALDHVAQHAEHFVGFFREHAGVFQRMLVAHAFARDLAREDGLAAREDLGREDHVVDVPHDDHQEGHQSFVAVRDLGRGDDLAR